MEAIRQVLSSFIKTRRSKTSEEAGFPKKVKATTTESPSHLSSCFNFSSLGDGVVRVDEEGGRCLVVVLEGWS